MNPTGNRNLYSSLVQLISLSRAAAAVVFASIALEQELHGLAVAVYAYALASDYIDGFLARRLGVTSRAGGAFDTSGDKFLTIASMAFAIARGITLPPCVLICFRDVLLQALRCIWIDGKPIVPTERLLGIATILPVRVVTFVLLLLPSATPAVLEQMSLVYWLLAAFSLASTTYTLWGARDSLLLGLRTPQSPAGDSSGLSRLPLQGLSPLELEQGVQGKAPGLKHGGH